MARLNQAEKDIPEFELGLRPPIEDLDKFAVNAIGGLRQANETRLLRNLLNQNIGIEPIDTGNLLIADDEAVKWLRIVYESKLLQKLAKSDSSLMVPDLEEFSILASTAQHKMVAVHDIKFVTELAQESSSLSIPNLCGLTLKTKRFSHALRMSADYRLLKQLSRISAPIASPPLQILASKGKMAYDSLRQTNDFMILRPWNSYKPALDLPDTVRFGAQTRLILKRLKTAQETRLLARIYKPERQRQKLIKSCYLSAEWAGSDLQRWNMVFAEYEKYPKRLKILHGLIDEAHSLFLTIMVKTVKMSEIKKFCLKNPFLIREFSILCNEMENYYSEQSVEGGEEKISECYKPLTDLKP